MSTEQVTEEDYDTLYDKGFDEGITETSEVEETEVVEEADQDEDLEQPTEDTQEETTTEPDEVEEATVDETEEDSKEEKYSIKINGQELELTLDEMKAFAQKGGDYTLKTQEVADIREYRDIIKSEDLSKEDLQLLADIKKGNKEALGSLVKQVNVDPFDIDTEDNNYKPEVIQKNYELDDAINSIKADSENGAVIDGWLGALPDSALNVMTQDPRILTDLHQETRAGNAQKVMPEVLKVMALNPNMDFRQAYMGVRGNVIQENTNTQPNEVKPVQSIPSASREDKLKGAIPKSSSSDKRKGKLSYEEEYNQIWDGGEEFKKLDSQLKKLRGY